MNSAASVPETPEPEGRRHPRAALAILHVLLFLEAAMMVAVVVALLVDLVADEPSSYATAIALTVIAAVGAIWTTGVAIASLRRAHWSRSAAIVWQFLQLSVAVGAFQGLFARPDLGWALLIPSVAVIVILLWPPVRAVYSPDRVED